MSLAPTPTAKSFLGSTGQPRKCPAVPTLTISWASPPSSECSPSLTANCSQTPARVCREKTSHEHLDAARIHRCDPAERRQNYDFLGLVVGSAKALSAHRLFQ